MTRRSVYETILVTVVVVLACLLAMGIYRGRVRVVAGKQLVQELALIREEVARFRMVNKTLPPHLEVLQPSLATLPRDPQGQPIDPFGSPYHYDPKTGWVSSTTPSYEHW